MHKYRFVFLFLSALLSSCENLAYVTPEFISYFLVGTYLSTVHSVALRGSCANPREGQAGVKIVEFDGRSPIIDKSNESPWSLSSGQHVIGIKLGHISKIQRLTLRFSFKHRYLLSATFNSETNKYQTHFWDETKYPPKKLSSFEFEATPEEIGQEKFEKFNCYSE